MGGATVAHPLGKCQGRRLPPLSFFLLRPCPPFIFLSSHPSAAPLISLPTSLPHPPHSRDSYLSAPEEIIEGPSDVENISYSKQYDEIYAKGLPLETKKPVKKPSKEAQAQEEGATKVRGEP
jgi:hypothetical protein